MKITMMSLQSVTKTLLHYYGDAFRWDIQSTAERGTVLELRIPYVRCGTPAVSYPQPQ